MFVRVCRYLGRKRLEGVENWVPGSKYLVTPNYSYWTVAYLLSARGARKLLKQEPLTNILRWTSTCPSCLTIIHGENAQHSLYIHGENALHSLYIHGENAQHSLYIHGENAQHSLTIIHGENAQHSLTIIHGENAQHSLTIIHGENAQHSLYALNRGVGHATITAVWTVPLFVPGYAI